jgi:hypothetical protein
MNELNNTQIIQEMFIYIDQANEEIMSKSNTKFKIVTISKTDLAKLRTKYNLNNFLKGKYTDIGSLIVFYDNYLHEIYQKFEVEISQQAQGIKLLRSPDENKTIRDELLDNLISIKELENMINKFVRVKRANIESETKLAIIDLKIKEVNYSYNQMIETLRDLVKKFITFNHEVRIGSGDYADRLYFKINQKNLEQIHSDLLNFKSNSEIDLSNLDDNRTEFLKIKTDVEKRTQEASEKMAKLQDQHYDDYQTTYVQPFRYNQRDEDMKEARKEEIVKESRSEKLKEELKKLKKEKEGYQDEFNNKKKAYEISEREYREEKLKLKDRLEEQCAKELRYITILTAILIFLIIIYIIIK